LDTERNAVLVTGAARRIGRAIALDLAKHGCDVAVQYSDSESEAQKTADMIGDLGRRAVLLKADMADVDAVAALPQQAAEALDGLHVLVNNAAVFEPMTLSEFSIERWNTTLATNLTAPMVLSHAAYPILRADHRGRIINVADIAAARPGPDHLAYCVSKAGLTTLTLALAKAMAPDVRVNAVAPGADLFPETEDKQELKAVSRRVPALRPGDPEDIAAAVRFMAMRCHYITGAVLAVDGGRSIAW
jgi:NAD(P)-dependent dehydrogenase (short-subunit alcohol dehydrogenase family)